MSVAGIDLPRKRAGCAGDARHGRVEFRRSALCYLGIGGFSVYIPGGNAALCIVCRSYGDAAHADICQPVGAVSLILEGIADRRGQIGRTDSFFGKDNLAIFCSVNTFY